MKVGDLVSDKYLPLKRGKVTKVSKSSVWVLWDDGETWRYDKAHQRFLVPGWS